jgi:hypothetical protein
MTSSQISKSLENYKDRVKTKLTERYSEVDMDRINRIIDMNFPDYRSIANHLEFELL